MWGGMAPLAHPWPILNLESKSMYVHVYVNVDIFIALVFRRSRMQSQTFFLEWNYLVQFSVSTFNPIHHNTFCQ